LTDLNIATLHTIAILKTLRLFGHGDTGVFMSNTFEVVFSGEVLDGFDPAETRAKIGKLFNADEAKIARLFSGNSIVIKKDLDEATANKYVGAFKNAGANAIARDAAAPAEAVVQEIQAAPPPAEEAPAAPTTKPASIPAAPAATGSSMFEHSGEASAHLTAAPKTQVELDSNPDLSAFSLREADGNLVDPSDDVPEANIDVGDISLASAGTDLGEAKEEPEEYNPDLSGITLVDN